MSLLIKASCGVLATAALVATAAPIDSVEQPVAANLERHARQVSPGMDDAARASVLNAHNQARASVKTNSGMPAVAPLTYDMALECAAQKVIAHLRQTNGPVSQHSWASERTQYYKDCLGVPKGSQLDSDISLYSVGENWYGGGAAGLTAFAVDYKYQGAWSDVTKSYQCSERDAFAANHPALAANVGVVPTNPGCVGKNDGHFTQVVWAATQKLGCASDPTYGTYCEYYPAGNMNGALPFTA